MQRAKPFIQEQHGIMSVGVDVGLSSMGVPISLIFRGDGSPPAVVPGAAPMAALQETVLKVMHAPPAQLGPTAAVQGGGIGAPQWSARMVSRDDVTQLQAELLRLPDGDERMVSLLSGGGVHGRKSDGDAEEDSRSGVPPLLFASAPAIVTLFWQDCGHCHSFAPQLAAAASSFEDQGIAVVGLEIGIANGGVPAVLIMRKGMHTASSPPGVIRGNFPVSSIVASAKKFVAGKESVLGGGDETLSFSVPDSVMQSFRSVNNERQQEDIRARRHKMIDAAIFGSDTSTAPAIKDTDEANDGDEIGGSDNDLPSQLFAAMKRVISDKGSALQGGGQAPAVRDGRAVCALYDALQAARHSQPTRIKALALEQGGRGGASSPLNPGHPQTLALMDAVQQAIANTADMRWMPSADVRVEAVYAAGSKAGAATAVPAAAPFSPEDVRLRWQDSGVIDGGGGQKGVTVQTKVSLRTGQPVFFSMNSLPHSKSALLASFQPGLMLEKTLIGGNMFRAEHVGNVRLHGGGGSFEFLKPVTGTVCFALRNRKTGQVVCTDARDVDVTGPTISEDSERVFAPASTAAVSGGWDSVTPMHLHVILQHVPTRTFLTLRGMLGAGAAPMSTVQTRVADAFVSWAMLPSSMRSRAALRDAVASTFDFHISGPTSRNVKQDRKVHSDASSVSVRDLL
jgi:thiol-disulfide isomerase/thioredoxin